MGNKKPKVMVALTCQRFVFARTVFSLIETAKTRDFEFDFYVEMGADIASSRNRLATEAKKRGASHLLFVDYDMFFPSTAVSELLSYDKDIIGAAYNFRKDPVQSTAIPLTEAKEDEPFKCNALGAGLLLIKTSVFDKIPQPWFLWGYNDDGTLKYGEDTYFFQKAIKHGFDVWAVNLGVKHVGEYLY